MFFFVRVFLNNILILKKTLTFSQYSLDSKNIFLYNSNRCNKQRDHYSNHYICPQSSRNSIIHKFLSNSN